MQHLINQGSTSLLILSLHVTPLIQNYMLHLYSAKFPSVNTYLLSSLSASLQVNICSVSCVWFSEFVWVCLSLSHCDCTQVSSKYLRAQTKLIFPPWAWGTRLFLPQKEMELWCQSLGQTKLSTFSCCLCGVNYTTCKQESQIHQIISRGHRLYSVALEETQRPWGQLPLKGLLPYIYICLHWLWLELPVFCSDGDTSYFIFLRVPSTHIKIQKVIPKNRTEFFHFSGSSCKILLLNQAGHNVFYIHGLQYQGFPTEQ